MTYLTNLNTEVVVKDLTITDITPTVKFNDTNNDIYIVRTTANRLQVFNDVSGAASVCGLFSKDGDRSDDVEYRAYGLGTDTASVNREFIRLRWNQAQDKYELTTEKNGTGVAKPIDISSNGNTNQVYLDTNGGVGIGKVPDFGKLDINLTTEGVAIMDAGSAGATQQDWIEVKVGGGTGYIHVYTAK